MHPSPSVRPFVHPVSLSLSRVCVCTLRRRSRSQASKVYIAPRCHIRVAIFTAAPPSFLSLFSTFLRGFHAVRSWGGDHTHRLHAFSDAAAEVFAGGGRNGRLRLNKGPTSSLPHPHSILSIPSFLPKVRLFPSFAALPPYVSFAMNTHHALLAAFPRMLGRPLRVRDFHAHPLGTHQVFSSLRIVHFGMHRLAYFFCLRARI